MAEFYFNVVDNSFDYGDFNGGTYYDYDYNGFTIDIDYFENVDFSSLKGTGDFEGIESRCRTLEQFRNEIANNLDYVDGTGSQRSEFEYLINLLDKQILKAA